MFAASARAGGSLLAASFNTVLACPAAGCRIREQIESFSAGQEAEWAKLSGETQDAFMRLTSAQQLVQHLGLEAGAPLHLQ